MTNWGDQVSVIGALPLNSAFAENAPSLTEYPEQYIVLAVEWAPSEALDVTLTAWREDAEGSMVVLAQLNWHASPTMDVRAGTRSRSGDEPSYFGGDQDGYTFALVSYRFLEG